MTVIEDRVNKIEYRQNNQTIETYEDGSVRLKYDGLPARGVERAEDVTLSVEAADGADDEYTEWVEKYEEEAREYARGVLFEDDASQRAVAIEAVGINTVEIDDGRGGVMRVSLDGDYQRQ